MEEVGAWIEGACNWCRERCGFGHARTWSHYRNPAPTVLSFRIGQTFEDVVKASTYAVTERSNIPTNAHLQSGATWVTEPAVILRFDDQKHGFTLPPTKFAAVQYIENRVVTVSTSPMLDKLPFDQAVAVLENLQNQFKAGGWEPWAEDGSEWFDLTPAGRKRLYEKMFQSGWYQTAQLRVPDKYAMTFRIWCASGCPNRTPPYLFLVDIGVGSDVHAELKADAPPPDTSPRVR